MSLSNYLEGKICDALRGDGNGTSYTAPAALYAKLHTGDPGEAGTSNAATETTRVEISFSAHTDGVMALAATATWTSVSTEETVSHISVWDNSTAGNCLFTGALDSSAALQAGDNFSLDTGTTLTIT